MIQQSSSSDRIERRYWLLTGTTGLVGRYLLKDLLLAGERVAVVARSNKRQLAQERVEAILQAWECSLGKVLPRPIVLEGDVTESMAGLSSQEIDWVRKNCGKIIHNAAILHFVGFDKTREPWRTNLNGTENMLELARAAKISNFHYVSTAYVSGQRTEVVCEDDLDCGQLFRNHYEQSKFEAEKLVRSCPWIDKPTIYRPAVISGDSESGFTNTYHGLYVYLRLIALLVPRQPQLPDGTRHTPIRLPMRGDEQRNIVPVDWVSKVITRLALDPAARGLTFHLAPEKPVTPRHVVESCYRYFNSTGVRFLGDDVGEVSNSAFEEEFLASIKMYNAYDQTDPAFDRTNLMKFCSDLPCPPIDEAMLYRYIEFGERDRWGKSKQKSPDVPQFATNFIRFLTRMGTSVGDGSPADLSHNKLKKTPEFGLDIVGPGGGQWLAYENGHGELIFSRGLPSDARVPVLRCDASQLENYLSDFSRETLGRELHFDESECLSELQQILRQLQSKVELSVN